jgi:hypothetical protein
MNDPGQYLVHMTSRGPKVAGVDGQVGDFKCYTTQPIKDINKFGLLHYSVPKMLDHVQDSNRTFTVRLQFQAGTFVDIPVSLPMLDYNDMYVTQTHDASFLDKEIGQNSGLDGRIKWRLAFDEVLQTTINWAIQDRCDALFQEHGGGANHTVSMKMLGRISCICDFNRTTGCYFIRFGYRATQTVAATTPGNPDQQFADGTRANSGCPFPTDGPHAAVGHGGNIAVQATGAYRYIPPSGLGNERNLDPLLVGGAYPALQHSQAVLVGAELRDMPLRVQLLLGCPAADVSHTLPAAGFYAPRQVFTRGRIMLCNYRTIVANVANGYSDSGLVNVTMSIPPNLDPPSLLYLQLTVPGTKTRILGQRDERGGWAIPTPPNEFVSKYQNLPGAQQYFENQTRYMPIIQLNPDAVANDPHGAPREYKYLYYANQAFMPIGPAHAAAVEEVPDGVGYNYDCIPIGASVAVAGGAGALQIDNWNRTAAPNPAASRFIKYQNGRHKFPRTDDQICQATPGLGVGKLREPAVFTASMIEPNWVYTSTEDATVQTFDIQLLWGDTCDRVTDVTGHPVQFSIIASP